MLGSINSAESLAYAFQVAEFGSLTLYLMLTMSAAFMLLCGWGIFKRDERFVQTARKGQYALFLMSALSCAVLWYMIFEGLYVSKYVHYVTEERESFFFKFVALWASQQGSLLFWCAVLNFCGVAFAFANRHSRTDRRIPYTLLALFGVQTFFMALIVLERSNPFATMLWWMHGSWFNAGDWGSYTLKEIHVFFEWLQLRKDLIEASPADRIQELKTVLGPINDSVASNFDGLRFALERANFNADQLEQLRSLTAGAPETWPQSLIQGMGQNGWTPEFVKQLMSNGNEWDDTVQQLATIKAGSADYFPNSEMLFRFLVVSNDSTINTFNASEINTLWQAVGNIDPEALQKASGGYAKYIAEMGVMPESGSLRDWAALSDNANMTLSETRSVILSDPAKLGSHFIADATDRWSDGSGINPQLHNYWIAIHPPTLYLGYIGFTVPFCYAVGSLLSGELGGEWIRKARIWTMTSWALLTAGIAMGGLWAYEILGWGGYWAWDPVENISFIPWLFATAFIHSVIVQERRGMLKVWNCVLIILTYSMTVIGTFLVRSGIIDSVHAFGDTGLRLPLLLFFVVTLVIPLLMTVWRMPLLKADRKLESVFSREAVFLFNNVVLCLIALTTLAMTFWPAITEFIFGETGKQQFGADAFTLVNGPLFLLLLLFTSIGPLLPYGKVTGREMRKAFRVPVIAAGVVFAINAGYLVSRDLIDPLPEGGDAIQTGVALVQILVQFALPAICAMIVAGVLQELIVPAKARKKSTNENLISAAFSVALGNRRRYGGYLAHIGIAMLAMGIYISSYYDVDTSAKLPEGGYALPGGADAEWAVVNDGSTATPLFRDIREQRPSVRKVLYAVRLLSENPDLSDEELIKRVRTSLPISGEGLNNTQRNAVIQFMQDPELTVDQRLEQVLEDAKQMQESGAHHNMPMLQGENLAKMRAGLTLAYDIVTLDEEDIRIAHEMADDARAMEYYETTVRAFRYTPTPPDKDAAQELLSLRDGLKAELGKLGQSGRDEILPSVPETYPQLRATDAYHKVIEKAYQMGPDIFPLLDLMESESSLAFLDLERLTNAIIRAGLFAHEEERSYQAVRSIVLGLEDNRKAAEELYNLGWRALGGLRRAERSDNEQIAAYASEKLAKIRAQGGVVRPRIEVYYDKRTGQPRRMGEDVRNPRITRYFSEDVYLILQGIDFGTNKSEDVAIVRVFIKPAMYLGLAGLAVILIGAVIAMLPRRRRTRSALN